jgi:hypothetical protein
MHRVQRVDACQGAHDETAAARAVRSSGEGSCDEHSGDESDDEEAGAVDVDYFTTLLQQGERY